jgi:sirohydrochlorin cobaltochelatase
MSAEPRTRGESGRVSEVGAAPSSPLSPFPAIILFAHGSRDPEWGAPFLDILHRVAGRLPDLAVRLAFLEFMQPALLDAAEALALAGHHRIMVAPLFLAQGGHLKDDLPRLIEELRRRHPGIAFELLPAAGDAVRVREAIGDWLVDTVTGRIHA